MKDNNLEFVTRHYRHGVFSAKETWKRLGISHHINSWRLRVAAAIASIVVLGGTATVLVNSLHTSKPDAETGAVTKTVTVTAEPLSVVKVIEFTDAPLSDVVKEIETVYAVKITGIQSGDETLRLTLRYEGNVADLLAAINDILGINLAVGNP